MTGADIPSERLGPYLAAHIPEFGDLQTAEKFSGGQSNPTYLLSATSGRYVLRRKPAGTLLQSAHAVDREFRVLSALAATDVPVAGIYHLCRDEGVIGSVFYVMEFVEGRVFWDQTLPGMDKAERSAIFDEMNRVLVAIHSVDTDAAGLSDFGRPGNYYARQYDRWMRQYRASETETIDAMEVLMDWLDAAMVPDDGLCALVHGDYRLDNLMLHPVRPQVLAVMDWELSTLGHPFADLAYQCMQWRMPANTIARGLGNTDRPAHGIPTEEEYVDLYCERMGLDGIDNWNFYLAFSFFRLAAITQGIKKRAVLGNASSEQALAVGALTRPLAELALQVIQQK